MENKLEDLIERARGVTMSSSDREEQRRSFVFGNTSMGNDRITREMIDSEADKLAVEPCNAEPRR